MSLNNKINNLCHISATGMMHIWSCQLKCHLNQQKFMEMTFIAIIVEYEYGLFADQN